MSILKVLLAVSFLGFQANAAIYGSDDRNDTQVSGDAHRLAKSTAMMVSPFHLLKKPNGNYKLDFPVISTSDSYALCSEEKFSKEVSSPIGCTGFLIAPNLLLTAGHCMVNVGEAVDTVNAHCRDMHWLFDYQTNNAGQIQTDEIHPSKIVKCKRVVYATHESTYNEVTKMTTPIRDFAIVELETPQNRPALSLRRTAPAKGEPLSMIGYPLGQAAKWTRAGTAYEQVTKDYFRTNLDVIGGNSGSPVFDAKWQVVGIAVRAFPNEDFIEQPRRNCYKLNRCSQDTRSCDVKDAYPTGSQVQTLESVLARLPR